VIGRLHRTASQRVSSWALKTAFANSISGTARKSPGTPSTSDQKKTERTMTSGDIPSSHLAGCGEKIVRAMKSVPAIPVATTSAPG
jgi:hypothetical protein